MDLNLHVGPPPHSRCRSSTAMASASDASTSLPRGFIDTSTPTDADAYSSYSPSRVPFSDFPRELPPISGVGDDASAGAFSPLSSSVLPDEPFVDSGSGGARVDASVTDYSPSYAQFPASPINQDGVDFASYLPIFSSVGSNPGDEDRISQSGLSESEFRIRLLINLRRRLRSIREFRSAMSSIHTAEQHVQRAPSSRGEEAEGPGENEAGTKGTSFINRLEDEKEEGEEKGTSVANFECNICLELAKEPVVTCCGHLFCWPCLSPWLHLYCSHMECPVCKGQVDESSIIPIYGRGSSEAAEGDTGVSRYQVPPRPRGRRVESLRQQISNPATRRFGGALSRSWMFLFGEQFWSRNRDLQENLEQGHGHRGTGLPRLGRRRSMSTADDSQNGYSGVGSMDAASDANPNRITTSSHDDDSSGWERFHFDSAGGSARLAALTSRLPRIFRRSTASSGNNQLSDYSPSADPGNPGSLASAMYPSNRSVDQLPTPSTSSGIRDDAEVALAVAEPNSAGPSSSLGRRGRSIFSGSLDVDGCLLHASKRRRLN